MAKDGHKQNNMCVEDRIKHAVLTPTARGTNPYQREGRQDYTCGLAQPQSWTHTELDIYQGNKNSSYQRMMVKPALDCREGSTP